MSLFLTSDLHLGHANIIAYTGRPFDSVDDMNEGLIDAWNETVAPSDSVWVLGDVCMGNIDRSLALVRRLHGTLHLLSGNHDRTFRRHDGRVDKRSAEWDRAYRRAGFVSIDNGTVTIDIGLREPILACHFPYSGDSQGIDRYPEQRPVDDGHPLLHGHTHGAWRQNGLMIDVGVDAWAGRPVHADELAAMISRGPANEAPLPWTRHAGDLAQRAK
jgi:calcineurin-like phosphoesterase family protein